MRGSRSAAGELLHPAIPVLRIYDLALARAFYVDFLGFRIDWEHRHGPDLPLYLQVSRGAVVLHLSEHHGDGTPGSVVWIRLDDPAALFAELAGKAARFARPDPHGTEAALTDPFGNVLRFDASRPG